MNSTSCILYEPKSRLGVSDRLAQLASHGLATDSYLFVLEAVEEKYKESLETVENREDVRHYVGFFAEVQ